MRAPAASQRASPPVYRVVHLAIHATLLPRLRIPDSDQVMHRQIISPLRSGLTYEVTWQASVSHTYAVLRLLGDQTIICIRGGITCT